MNQLEVAVRRYQSVLPSSVSKAIRENIYKPDLFPKRAVKDWLNDRVVPALRPMLANHWFRDSARWPLLAFAKDASTNERHLLDEVDSALVANADTLSQIAENLPSGMSPKEADDFELAKSQCQDIRGRCWGDLFSRRDYFGPTEDQVRFDEEWESQRVSRTANCTLNAVETVRIEPALPKPTIHAVKTTCDPQVSDKPPTLGHWMMDTAFNPELWLVGNTCVNCMLHRIRLYVEMLNRRGGTGNRW